MKVTILTSILVFSFSTSVQASILTCSNSPTDFIVVDDQTNAVKISSAAGERNLTLLGFNDYYIDPKERGFDITDDAGLFGLFRKSGEAARWHSYYEFENEDGFYLVTDEYNDGRYVGKLSTDIEGKGKVLHSYKSCK